MGFLGASNPAPGLLFAAGLLLLAGCGSLDGPGRGGGAPPRAEPLPEPRETPRPADPPRNDRPPPPPPPVIAEDDLGPEPPEPTGPRRVLVLIVHGTAADPSGRGEDLSWTDPKAKDSFAWRLRRRLRERLPDAQVTVQPYRWQGWHDHDARHEAARQLRRILESVPADSDVHLVGHGHGGSVALHAVGMAARKPGQVVTLGMPILCATLRNLRNDRSWFFPVYVPPPPTLREVELACVYSPEDTCSISGASRGAVEPSLAAGDNRTSELSAWRVFHGLAEDVPFVTKKGEVRWKWEFPADDATERQTLSRAVWKQARNVPVRAAGRIDPAELHGALHDPAMGAAVADVLAGDDPERTLARRGLDRYPFPPPRR